MDESLLFQLHISDSRNGLCHGIQTNDGVIRVRSVRIHIGHADMTGKDRLTMAAHNDMTKG